MGICLRIGGLAVGSSGSSWTPQKIADTFLFYGETSKIADGKLYNQVQGSSDYLTVGGSAGSETYQAPNTADYNNADIDELWKDWSYTLRTATTTELIGFDFSRTLIKYDDASPYQIREIFILKSDAVLSIRDINLISKYCHLPIYWSGVPNLNGYLKGNRGLVRSIFTPDANLILTDTYTKAWYDPLSVNGRIHVNGIESVYWDKMVAYGTLGAIETSGTTIAFGVYKIITTQVNYFYAGCAVGDIFVGLTTQVLSALNNVQRYTGNHLANFTSSKRPINQVFDGISQFMKTPTFTFDQPMFYYLMIKQLSWTSADYLFDGANSNGGMAQQAGASPKFLVYAGAASGQCSDLAINEWGLIRVYFNGATSKLIVNEHNAITGNFGTAHCDGIVIGANVSGTTGFSNIQFAEGILRTSDSSEAAILNYFKIKYSL